MKPERMQRSEDLTMEREWQADGITVLRAEVTLPQCGGSSRRARRFNRYYRSYAKAYLHYCERELYPRAAAQLRWAMVRSAPWQAAQAQLHYTVTLVREDILSLYTDATETGGGVSCPLRRSDTWSLADGLPLAMEDFFPLGAQGKKTLLRRLRAQLLERTERGEDFGRCWRLRLRCFFSPRNFYLTEHALVCFYPAGTLRRGGIETFSLPYGEAGVQLPPLP